MTDQTINKTEGKKEGTVKRNEAFNTLKELVMKTNDAKYIDALKVLRPSFFGAVGGGAGVARTPKFQEVIDMIAAKKTVTEDEIFKLHKIGRKEVSWMIRQSLKKSEPAKRIWVKFDADKGIYTYLSTGAKAPEGYVGFVPVDEVADIKADAPKKPGLFGGSK